MRVLTKLVVDALRTKMRLKWNEGESNLNESISVFFLFLIKVVFKYFIFDLTQEINLLRKF